jgi:hypothetical protein
MPPQSNQSGSLPAGYTLDTPTGLPAGYTLDSPAAKVPAVKPPAPADSRSALQRYAEDPNTIPLDSYTHATEYGLNNIGKGVAQGVQGGWNLLKTAAKAWNDPKADVGDAMFPDPHVEQVPGAIRDINQSPDPLGTYAKAAADTAGQGAGQLGTMIAAEKLASVPESLRKMTAPPEANLVRDTYSHAGDRISSALRSNTKVDVPAEGKIAAPAIEEGLNDRGITTQSFKGRNGPAALQAGIDNALDIHEARAKAMIDPIRGEAVDPQTLAKNPELTSRFLDKDGNLPQKGITYGDLDAQRIQLNKELRMGNFYGKAPSAQYAIQDPMAAIHDAANQARELVYNKVGERTGLDIGPVKRTESALIKLGDLAETTKNTLSPKEAQFNTTPLHKKVGGSVQGLLSVKANPINAFSIPEKPGLFNPLNEFNSHMQKAFPNLKAAAADRTVTFPKYNLELNSPGQMPPPLQRALSLSGGENIPGEDLKLTPPGDMPPALQRVLGFEDPGVPSELYPGVRPKK